MYPHPLFRAICIQRMAYLTEGLAVLDWPYVRYMLLVVKRQMSNS